MDLVQETVFPQEIVSLDLILIERKVMKDHNWSPARAADAVEGYRQFLVLMLEFPGRSLVPSEDIDKVWHQHIEWTERYEQDCHRIFGRLQHHYPCFEMGPERAVRQRSNREATIALFKERFGECPTSYASSELDSCNCYREDA